METLIAFAVAFLITLVFVWLYLRGMQTPATAPAAAPSFDCIPRRACPRCSASIAADAAFCLRCGAPLSLWNVHTAELAKPGAATQSAKPRPVISASLCIGCGSCVDACPEQGTLALAGGKAILANPDSCVGHAACVTACPTSALTLTFGGVRQTLRVPNISANFETNVPGLFIAGELGGLGLIKTSINEGRIAADHLRARLAALPPLPPQDDLFDVIVVGAGPAGLSASLSLHQYEIRYLTLEQGEIASTIRNYPRHKFLMAEPIEMPLYGNLYIADSTKEALLDVWQTIIANTGVRIRTNTKVESVARDPASGLFLVRTPAGVFRARFVLLAIGKRGSPRKLGVPGEGLAHVAYRVIEAESYDNSDIVLVGGGDSALEAAVALSRDRRNRVALLHRSRDFSRARDRNRAALEQAEQQARVRIFRESAILSIQPGSLQLRHPSGEEQLPAAYVFILAGGESPEDFLLRAGVEIVEKALAA